MTSYDIIKRAQELKKYVYWYGGKRQKCTQTLLNTLAKQYPSVYTSTYIAKCKKDIDGETRCCDCSGLASYAYNISDLGTYGLKEKYKEWTGEPKNGMMVWKKTHVGIYNDGKVIEMKGVDYDYTENRTYQKSDWTAVLYDPNVDYENGTNTSGYCDASTVLNIIANVLAGNLGSGDVRTRQVEALGANAADVQYLINLMYKVRKNG